MMRARTSQAWLTGTRGNSWRLEVPVLPSKSGTWFGKLGSLMGRGFTAHSPLAGHLDHRYSNEDEPSYKG